MLLFAVHWTFPMSDCTCSSLRMAARRLTQAYDAALAPARINTSQFALLGALDRWAGELPTVGALADRLALDRTTLAHNLRPLQRDGLVAIGVDGEDRRVRRIRLTEAGRARRHAAFRLWREAQDRFDSAFGAARSAELRRALDAIAHDVALPGSASGELETSHVV